MLEREMHRRLKKITNWFSLDSLPRTRGSIRPDFWDNKNHRHIEIKRGVPRGYKRRANFTLPSKYISGYKFNNYIDYQIEKYPKPLTLIVYHPYTKTLTELTRKTFT